MKKIEAKGKKSDNLAHNRQNKSNMIKQMVDNILREGEEVGHSSGEDDGDLSGDEIK